ncbi:hypothetical protein J7T55_006339 [Diaporthe amygdali]|uniref:uncharacterized protein n=1 Tax=Phomopsis amygdali TaxID=1214568 RepID=UPI0022FF1F0B|nr:uncharacterized protein J7T55_006339 [Diaporthe amygdali]KAJ0124996.1 hypothetical protein J7T55_006339 [Diaporthe amygdali]
MLSQLPAALCLLLCSAAGTAASSLVLFSDANCQTSQTRLAGENGYPDGYCTNIAEVADATYKSFMFTVLDDGCTPTIYQKDSTSDICSGDQIIGYISRCYNTSWVYYSIDMCTSVTTSDASSATSTSSSTSSASSTSIATSNGVSGGAIAGAVVGSVCGLGIIAAVCVYFFWFRPKQRERKRREIEESGMKDGGGASSTGAMRKEEEDGEAYLISMHQSQQRPHELQSMPDVFEAPGDIHATELDNGEPPVELPGDHEYQGGHSNNTSIRDQNSRH